MGELASSSFAAEMDGKYERTLKEFFGREHVLFSAGICSSPSLPKSSPPCSHMKTIISQSRKSVLIVSLASKDPAPFTRSD
ncbi:rCG57020 [Rattus norvegicus]|uniref:RCG57020 n=1 Tax=Rattus norvegicus TaxID=10116 RepID=A6JDG6_RAT|nr:rCG57020 [Rattus norvegicus]